MGEVDIWTGGGLIFGKMAVNIVFEWVPLRICKFKFVNWKDNLIFSNIQWLKVNFNLLKLQLKNIDVE